MSVYGSEGVPPPRSVQNNNNLDNITSVLDIANLYVVSLRRLGLAHTAVKCHRNSSGGDTTLDGGWICRRPNERGSGRFNGKLDESVAA